MSVLLVISAILFATAAIGVIAGLVQMILVVRFFRRPEERKPAKVGISILKPLCGVDDDLEANIRQFATFRYPDYELILGVKDPKDPAYAVAQDAVRRWPDRVRLVLQRGEPGLNPKVNQLCTLLQEARKEIVLVSDSNCRAPEGYLEEIASHFADPDVACTSNPIIGTGEEKLGSLLDNFHMASFIAPGVISAKESIGQDIVVGKSMALRRKDLDAMGGFHVARNHLAEDYVIGQKLSQMGKRVVLCRRPVLQVSQRRTYRDFLSRQMRWSIIHRTAIAPWTYLGQGAMMAAVPFAFLGLLASPSRLTLVGFAATWALKTAMDTVALRLHRPAAYGLKTPLYGLLKDFSIFVAWANGIVRRTVVWRGTRLRVEHGSLLRPPAGAPSPALAAIPAEPSWTEARRQGDRTAA
jgi:ceramide glucosyltransferase